MVEDRPQQDDTQGVGPGRILAGRYRLVRLLSHGGMSRVFVGEDSRLGTEVAVKLFDATRFAGRDDEHIARRRFFREARLAASLVHPNIVPVHDLGEEDGLPFIVERLVEGPTLGQIIRQGPPPPLDAALAVMLDLVAGLGAAHEKGVLHHDIKPENVILDGDGRPCSSTSAWPRSTTRPPRR